MKQSHILFAWIGGSDRKAAGIPRETQDTSSEHHARGENKADGPGPIARTLLQDSVAYSKSVLLSDDPLKDALYKTWLEGRLEAVEGRPKPEIVLVSYKGRAMDRREIYEASRRAVAAHAPDNPESGPLRTYILSSGTPVMHLCWTLLAHTHAYSARMIEPYFIRRDGEVKEGIDIIEPWLELKQAFPQPPVNDLDDLLVEEYHNALKHSATARLAVGIKEQIAFAARAAKTPSNWRILILGESGTGKEVLTNIIHEMDSNYQGKTGKYYAINCGAIPENLIESELFGHEKGAFTGAMKQKMGHIEQAANGTLFLDEIGELSLSAQVKFLRFLQEGKFKRVGGDEDIEVENVRVIAATHQDLLKLVKDKKFRNDLYYRLDGISFRLPSLRERRKDIKALSISYVNKWNQESGYSVSIEESCFGKLRSYHWPGNIRELENVLRKAYLLVFPLFNPVITGQILEAVFDNAIQEYGSDPLNEANLYNIIHDEPPGFNFTTWSDQIKYHTYSRLVEHQQTTGKREEKTRTWLWQKIGAASSGHLCQWEDKWRAEGKAIDPNRTGEEDEAPGSRKSPSRRPASKPPIKP